ncbi:uncharacterized protein LOC133641562 isoform X2 [Entelurus aequoreus]|uniref:uncharacterized protein LOC133641562 isoform X2 n=1 Tax=Entelurus aequoreus TaxID=161455 RepID=UPI002B1CE8E0|nr:uncharacterized protein LOC133641562 isoform X2 [Entelurus aequoreus]
MREERPKQTRDQIMASTTTASVADAVDEPMAMALDLPDEEGDQDQGNTREQGCQMDWVPIGTAPTAMTSSKSTQTGKIHHRSKGHQVTPEILERVRARPARVSEVPSSSVAAPSDSPEMQTNIATPVVLPMTAMCRVSHRHRIRVNLTGCQIPHILPRCGKRAATRNRSTSSFFFFLQIFFIEFCRQYSMMDHGNSKLRYLHILQHVT